MTAHLIDSKFSIASPERLPDFDEYVVKNEPMLFNCEFAAADGLGGPITQAFLERLPRDWWHVPLVIDSRVHMLMPGWYPCIPGWHHDDVPRTRSDGQPNYAPGQCRSEHIMALVNGDICPTEFAVGAEVFDEPELGRVIYSDWHAEVERRLERNKRWAADIRAGLVVPAKPLTRFIAPSNRLIQFNDRTWHRGTPAVATGWRFFIRASRYYDADGKPIARGNARTNEVRRQVQVYMSDVNAGW